MYCRGRDELLYVPLLGHVLDEVVETEGGVDGAKEAEELVGGVSGERHGGHVAGVGAGSGGLPGGEAADPFAGDGVFPAG